MAKTEFGFMACRECGSQVKVFQNEHGTLSYNCQAKGCDDTDYAKFSTLKNTRWRSRIEAFGDPEPPPKAAKGVVPGVPSPEGAPETAGKKSGNIWGV